MPGITMPKTERPQFKAPAGANMSHVWRDARGVLQEHDIELPVDPKTFKINGKLYACTLPDCPTAELVIEPKTELAENKKHCPRDGKLLSFVPLDDTQGDPVGSGRLEQQAWLARIWAKKKQDTADRLRKTAMMQAALEARMLAPQKLAELATDMRGHLPSLAATAAIELGVIYTVDLTEPLQTAAIGAAVTAGGVIAGYLLAVVVEKIRLRLRKEGFEGRAAKKARERGLWAGRGAISCGLYLSATGLAEALAGGLGQVSPIGWGILALLGIGLAWWTSGAHWERLWSQKRRLRALAAEKVRKAAEEAAAKAAAEAARALAEAELRAQQMDLTEELGEELDENNPLHQGKMMQLEWQRIAALPTAASGFPKISQTRINAEDTREITAPDPENPTKRIRIGWEFTGSCEPGALVAANGVQEPIMSARPWLVSVLHEGRYDAGAISLVDRPGGKQNTFLMMITERARLGDAVPWRADKAVRIDSKGIRYGYLGRALTGDDLEEILYAPTQPFGGLGTGTTGGGKSVLAQRHILNLLLACILPVLHDPKGLADYGDFAGMFPMGFTNRHRRIILTSLAMERDRRQGRLAAAPKTNRYGAVVGGESRWNTHDEKTGEIGVYGEPIEAIFDEFHNHVKDSPQFIVDLTNHVRLQRGVAMGAFLLSQGGGLEDWGSSVLRDLGGLTSRTNFRGGEMQTRLSGGRSKYSTADLPNLPGMCLREAPGSPDIPLRAAFISRDPGAEDTIYTTLWGKGAKPVMQIPDPMNWISDETKDLWETTGLMELWRLGRGPGGLEKLLADNEEDEEDELAATALVLSRSGAPVRQQQQPAGAGRPARRMHAREVLLAILHETPGLDRDKILKSDAWFRAPGWTGPCSGETLSRAATDLDGGSGQLPAGAVCKLDRGPKSASWTLTEAGAPYGARFAAQLAPKQVESGQQVPTQPGLPQPMAAAISMVEMAAQRNAEVQAMVAREAAMAQAAMAAQAGWE